MDILSTAAPATDRATGRSANRRRAAKAFRQLSLAIAIYGMIEWIFVAINSLVAPGTLPLPLTHLLPHLREDTSGVICFALSFLGFISYQLTRPEHPAA